MALGAEHIDAGSFTAIRLLSGALALLLFIFFIDRGVSSTQTVTSRSNERSFSWAQMDLSFTFLKKVLVYAASPFFLFIYALTFSYAYLSLSTGTGALILFGAVQLSMLVFGLASGKKLIWREYIGVGIAFVGFVILVAPEIKTPSLNGFLLMGISGVSWAAYTLLGMGSTNALRDTAINFFRTVPMVIILGVLLLAFGKMQVSYVGVLLAVASGVMASAIGYGMWYVALRSLSSIEAGGVQLLVPVIASIGGVVFTNDIVSVRQIVSTVLVLGGILCLLLARRAK